MDPDKAWNDACNAVAERDWNAAYEALQAVEGWIRRGAVAPELYRYEAIKMLVLLAEQLAEQEE